ncbi:glyoxalase/bleomycin resistance protein/dioxygenase superfamily protein [Pseudomonas sp. AG1028]|uniref:VOC family protein n=1 Tax=Pseudomonas sp. AG1028 TaxID=2572911 RepID=UPI0011AD8D27|nr:VOC family protein [Pseudomonas sp. AG1028]TWE02253.1 glyoxalase/bleomycin resistance protein/dioxygenase superfamily protein [Pseudomonas sp. AG1028]
MEGQSTEDDFDSRMMRLVEKCHREKRLIMNHVCVRVEDIDRTEKLLAESFGIGAFNRVTGSLFKGEAAVSGAWVSDEFYLELMKPLEKQQLGYDTGCATPIGHLSEIGFLTPDMDAEVERLSKLGWRMTDSLSSEHSREVKMDMQPSIGFPIELMEIKAP